MKVQIPEQLKQDVPQTLWGRILTATPVIMAVVATMLAGLASSEMNRAQYARSLAAQQQSKAGDQWSFFQAKRLRGAMQLSSLDLLRSLTLVQPFSEAALRKETDQLDAGNAELKAQVSRWLASTNASPALAALARHEAPQPGASVSVDPAIQALQHAVEAGRPEAELTPLVARIKPQTVEQALVQAREQIQGYDQLTKPINDSIAGIQEFIARFPARTGGGDSLERDFAAARMQYTASRYENEARLNQGVANLYEVQVRQSNYLAARHHLRSQRFFIGMLAAQLGVIISTFAIAARKRNLLWSLAAGAGVIAISFAIYVYLYV